ncbi:MAG: hypothetical protein GDA51_10140 [Ekhidna sp.]|nr:hypothetical protein [Ekhidna sp.]MBC6409919.1 hypothetical protein [Ekhidna sp.]MBC6426805.1 hypothetical protein [Ekhidna sp.]
MFERGIREDESYSNKRKEQKELFEIQDNKVKHNLATWSIYILWFFVVAMFIVRILHLLFPTNSHWLSETQIQSLDKLLFSGSIGGILGEFGGTIFEK